VLVAVVRLAGTEPGVSPVGFGHLAGPAACEAIAQF